MTSIKQIEATKRQNDEFSAWRKEQAARMPDLAARVFALRGTGYAGSGFHWGLEKLLGLCIYSLNNYDDASLYHGEDAMALQLVLKVQVEGLEEDLAKAEAK